MDEERSSAEVESRHDDGNESYGENLELDARNRPTDDNDSDDLENDLPGGEDEKAKKEKKLQQRRLQEVFEVLLVYKIEAEKLIQEMEAANFNDIENNKAGKPALKKLHMMDSLQTKLKNAQFAKAFLDKGGLDQLYHFLKKLPDGSLPLSSVRTSIYSILLELPYEEHHLKATKIGRFFETRQNSYLSL